MPVANKMSRVSDPVSLRIPQGPQLVTRPGILPEPEPDADALRSEWRLARYPEPKPFKAQVMTRIPKRTPSLTGFYCYAGKVDMKSSAVARTRLKPYRDSTMSSMAAVEGET